jgi:phenylpyruvate tautomerase PptA (4-oxalocrotonate tautomerase family)
MPICEITFASGLLSKNEQEKIVERVSALLLKAEGLIDNPISRSICLVNLNESSTMYIGGKISNKGKIIVKIYIFENAYSDSIKKNIYSDIANIFIEENKITKELKGNNIWCVIFPIQANDFGVGGKPATLELTRKVVSSYK